MSPVYLAIVCLGWALTTYLFIKALREKDAAHNRNVGQLLNRIQKPELAVAQSIADPDASKEQIYVPFDDDAAHWAYREERS